MSPELKEKLEEILYHCQCQDTAHRLTELILQEEADSLQVLQTSRTVATNSPVMQLQVQLAELLEVDCMIDMKSGLRKLKEQLERDELVLMPGPTTMTEQMVDATRPVHLHYMDGNGGASGASMRRHIAMGWPWLADYYPEWFRTFEGHLTKADRAILCHALTVGAALDPDAKQRWYATNAASRPRLKAVQAMIIESVKLNLTMTGPNGEVKTEVVVRVPMAPNLFGDQPQKHQLQLVRNDLPKADRDNFPKFIANVVFFASGDNGIVHDRTILSSIKDGWKAQLMGLSISKFRHTDRPLEMVSLDCFDDIVRKELPEGKLLT